MSAFLTALLLALGAGTWIYTKLQNKTGYGNSKSAFMGALVSGIVIFVVVLTVALMIL